MPLFHDCTALGAPGWDATDGCFYLADGGALRFARTFRNKASHLTVHLDADTPRALERRLAGYGARVAAADDAARGILR